MKTSTMQLGNHTVITLKESVNHQNCKELEASILDAAEKNQRSIILECKGASYFDSAALETLLRLQDAVKERGGQVKLAGLNALCQDIMIATRLINQFNIYSNVPEAVKDPS